MEIIPALRPQASNHTLHHRHLPCQAARESRWRRANELIRLILTLDAFYVSLPTAANISKTTDRYQEYSSTARCCVAIVVDVAGIDAVDVDIAAVYCCFVVLTFLSSPWPQERRLQYFWTGKNNIIARIYDTYLKSIL